jgi:ABC-type branched-subunit amino acid transport system ATPase component
MELELTNITKRFGGVTAVNDVSIVFEKGRIAALIGPNGAGKTTLFDIISGFLAPNNGKVVFRDQAITGLPPFDIARKGIGRMFQDVRVFDRMSLIENVCVARKNQLGENPLCALLRPKRIARSQRETREAAMELLRSVGLESKASLWAEHLSYGQQKLLAVCRLIANDSELLLLDEPTAGVNPAMIGEILELIRRLAKNGKTVLIIEHNLNVVLSLCDWVYLLDDGELVAFGTAKEVLGDGALQVAYLGA